MTSWGWSLIQYDWCPYEKRGIWTQTHTQRRHSGKMAMHRWRQRSEWCCQGPPEGGRAKKGFSPRAFGERKTLPTPWFQTSGLQICGRTRFCCFKPRSLWCCVGQSWETHVCRFYYKSTEKASFSFFKTIKWNDKKKKLSPPGTVAHVYNPRTLETRGGRIAEGQELKTSLRNIARPPPQQKI